MKRKRTIIPKAPVARILFNAGAKRVSDDAVDELALFLTQSALKISAKAIEMTKHGRRKTINSDDIRLAFKV